MIGRGETQPNRLFKSHRLSFKRGTLNGFVTGRKGDPKPNINPSPSSVVSLELPYDVARREGGRIP